MISKMVGYLMIIHKWNLLYMGIFLKIEFCVGGVILDMGKYSKWRCKPCQLVNLRNFQTHYCYMRLKVVWKIYNETKAMIVLVS